MAGNFILGVDVAQAPRASGTRAALLFKGRHRKMIKKLLFYAKAVQRQDEASTRRGQANFTIGPALVELRGNADDKAVKRIIARCEEALKSKG